MIKTDEEVLRAMAPRLKHPSIREIARSLGYASNQSVMDRIKKLMRLGLVRKEGTRYVPIKVPVTIRICDEFNQSGGTNHD